MISLLQLAFEILFSVTSLFAQGTSGCPNGTYSVVKSPDGGTLSVLFDNFIVEAGGNTGLSSANKSCNLNIPLGLPEGFSIGVYKVDYRGFAQLSDKQTSDLIVDYALGPQDNGRSYHRAVRGSYSGDFLFTETLGAGAMKRVGCGEAAKLNVTIALTLQTNGRSDQALASLDSADGAPKGGLIYHFDYKKCH